MSDAEPHEDARTVHRAHFEASLAAFEAATQFALEAIRTTALINGGAVVAILAFSQSLFSSGAESRMLAVRLAELGHFFAWGAVLAGLGAVLAYIAQNALYTSSQAQELCLEWPRVRNTTSSIIWGFVGYGCKVFAFAAVGASYFQLLSGMNQVRVLFSAAA